MMSELAGRLLIALLAVMAIPNIAAAQANSTTSRTIWDGVYTTAQANRGRNLYRMNCVRCHQADLTGNTTAPMLKGDPFMERWREDTLNAVFTYMRIRMPPPSTDPRLPNNTYLDIVAHIMRENGFPEGMTELTVDALPSIRVQKKEGPQPLPSNAVTIVVGCFTEANGAWTLTRATQPGRTRNIAELRAQELEASAAKPLGTGTVQLRNLEFLDSFEPASFRGHKVQARGGFTQDDTGARVNVAAIETIAQTCD